MLFPCMYHCESSRIVKLGLCGRTCVHVCACVPVRTKLIDDKISLRIVSYQNSLRPLHLIVDPSRVSFVTKYITSSTLECDCISSIRSLIGVTKNKKTLLSYM